MDFPDMHSLAECAKCHGFRPPDAGEAEEGYRVALAAHVEPMDYIESMEIRNKVGWDQFSSAQNENMVRRLPRRNGEGALFPWEE